MKFVFFTVALGVFSAFASNAAPPVPDNVTGSGNFDATPRFRRNQQTKNSRDHAARMMLIRQLLLDNYDLDGNGLIEGEERKRLLRDAANARDEAMRSLLKKFDLDGDGKLNTTEYEELLKHIRPQRRARMRHRQAEKNAPEGDHCPMPPQRGGPLALLTSKLILDKYDTNGNGTLEPNELQSFMNDARNLFEERRKELLDRFDANQDGTFTPEEAETAKRTLREEREVEAAFPEHDPVDMYLNTHYDMDVIRSLDIQPQR